MTRRMQRFNTYLLTVCLAAIPLAGCSTGGSKGDKAASKSDSGKSKDKDVALLRLHVQVNPDNTPFTVPVAVFRENPVTFHVMANPMISEKNIAQAELVDDVTGYSIRLFLDSSGTMLLENATTSYRNSRLVVFAQWGTEKKSDGGRWLGAVYVTQSIKNGIFTFTPDASREEAEKIVVGLNNVAHKLRTERR